MKKLLFVGILFSALGIAKADDTPTLWVSFGKLNVYVPLTQIDVVYQYDFVGKRSLIGGETPIVGYKRAIFTGGAITSIEGEGSPFLGMHFIVDNPIPTWFSKTLADIQPGIFGGRDFNHNAWIFGLKVSKNIF